MKRAEFDNLRTGDKVRKRARREIWTIILNDCKSVVAIRGEEVVEAARLVHPKNWVLGGSPRARMTDHELDQLGIGGIVCNASDLSRTNPFTVVLIDGDFIVAIKGAEIVKVERFCNPVAIVHV